MPAPPVVIRSQCDHPLGSQPPTKKRKAAIEIDTAFLDEVWDLKRLAKVIRMKTGEDQLSEDSLREAFLAYMTNPVVRSARSPLRTLGSSSDGSYLKYR